MRRSRSRRVVVRGAAALVGLIVVTLAAWIAVAGPVTVLRIIRFGDTQIDDFTHYPGRELHPGDSPHEFARAGEALAVPAAVFADLGIAGDLDLILSENDTIAFLVLRDDELLYERYFQGHTASSLSQAFSASKSLTSALIGMAIDDGYLEGVDQPITDLVPELAPAGFGSVTLKHLLTMTSGSSYQENDNPFGEHVILNYTPELEQRILAFTIERPPGELFRYKSGDNALLGLALTRALGGETITAYAQRRLWTPLGMQDGGVWTIDHEGDGLEKTWCCLAASARDFAKFGRLYLERGEWDGRRIVSAQWVDQSTGQSQVPAAIWPEDYGAIGWRGYGYQWWLATEADGDYFALGKDGQFIYVNPARGVVIVRLGWSQGDLRSSQWIALFQRIAGRVP